MRRSRAVLYLLLVVAFASAVPASAYADTITFVGPIGPIDPGNPTVEGIFRYDVLSGQLFRDSDGNPGEDMEGSSGGGGGVLRVVRNDMVGGLFTFDASDIRFEYDMAVQITFTGLLNGITQGTDVFTTTADSTWTTVDSINLAGVDINELEVTLIASPTTATDIDNLVLTPVTSSTTPEPSSLLLLGSGIGGLAGMLRRKLTI